MALWRRVCSNYQKRRHSSADDHRANNAALFSLKTPGGRTGRCVPRVFEGGSRNLLRIGPGARASQLVLLSFNFRATTRWPRCEERKWPRREEKKKKKKETRGTISWRLAAETEFCGPNVWFSIFNFSFFFPTSFRGSFVLQNYSSPYSSSGGTHLKQRKEKR